MTELLYLTPAGEILQGDIYAQMPSVYVESRPLRIARHWKVSGTRDVWEVHPEDGAGPGGGFKWRMDQGGEPALLVHAHIGLAMVISHDCEIENDPNVRTLAMIRPVGELERSAQEALFSGRDDQVRYAIFPLDAQDTEPEMERAFVDFRRLTTVRPAVLDASRRVASLSDELRFAVAERFRQYLFRRVERPATDL
jgi:hypothetical protein